MREVRCELAKIIINETQDGQVVWLKEVEGSRTFAIVVGFFEASSLRDRVKEFNPQRPMTHHLVMNCVHGLGGKLDRIVVSQLKDNTYYAKLMVLQDGKTIEIDSRPSDALVLAVQESAPVYVAEDVLAEASKWSVAPQITFTAEELGLDDLDELGEDDAGQGEEDDL